MILVGPSLGAAIAIDFAVNYPEAVSIYNSFHQGLSPADASLQHVKKL